MNNSNLIICCDNIITCRGKGKPKTGKELADAGLLKDGAMVIKDGFILDMGKKDAILSLHKPGEDFSLIDFGKSSILPGFIDSHTHPLFAGNRVDEFIMRARGATYQEIHEAGGGIQFTVDHTKKASDEELLKSTKKVIQRMLSHGTTTLEAKSGYGLDLQEEIRQLKILKKAGEQSPVDMVLTCLGAHSIPRENKHNPDEYVDLIIEKMLPLVKKQDLARFVDVFCEEGAFSLDQTRRVLESAQKLGFSLKIHSEEFTNQGSALLGGQMGAVSVDHLLKISDSDIEALAHTDTILTLMPGTLFFLNYNEFAPARKIIEGGAKIALATDYNAGSCMSASMPMAMSLACIKMKMLPEEAINASTYNASFALEMNNRVGSLEPGKQADFAVFDVEDYRLIPYHFGENLITHVYKKGAAVVKRQPE